MRPPAAALSSEEVPLVEPVRPSYARASHRGGESESPARLPGAPSWSAAYTAAQNVDRGVTPEESEERPRARSVGRLPGSEPPPRGRGVTPPPPVLHTGRSWRRPPVRVWGIPSVDRSGPDTRAGVIGVLPPGCDRSRPCTRAGERPRKPVPTEGRHTARCADDGRPGPLPHPAARGASGAVCRPFHSTGRFQSGPAVVCGSETKRSGYAARPTVGTRRRRGTAVSGCAGVGGCSEASHTPARAVSGVLSRPGAASV